MGIFDYTVLGLFFAVLAAIGFWAFSKVKGSSDFYVAGGKVPWWISGISHHVSGYSGVVFTGYAAIAYSYGFTLWAWWSTATAIACFVGAYTVAPRWARLREHYNVQSPTEYLRMRYGLATQQVMAVFGALLKLLDVGAKYAAIGVLMNGFTGLPFSIGILVSGVIALLYVTVGGLWADTLNDTFQFFIQFIAGILMFILISRQLGSMQLNYLTMWKELPASHSDFFTGPYTLTFALAIIFVAFLSYNGGTWNLALRYLSSPTGKTAKKAALLSGSLYLLWPLVMFAPMWASPLLFPNLESGEANNIYSMLTLRYLPTGMVGLVLASMFAATMSMIASDANAVSSVITRDVLPLMMPKAKEKTSLVTARLVTFSFTALALLIALNKDAFGDIIGLIITWFSGLIGPASIPMIFGLFATFRYTKEVGALSSIGAGFFGFIFINFIIQDAPTSLSILVPNIFALLTFVTFEIVGRVQGKEDLKVREFTKKLEGDLVLHSPEELS